MEKEALLGHIARVLRQDIPGTPRWVLPEASPAQLHGIQATGNNLLGPLKVKAEGLPGILRKPAQLVLNHPELALTAPLPPGSGPLAMGAKKLLEKGIDYALPLPKIAMSGALLGDLKAVASHGPAIRLKRGAEQFAARDFNADAARLVAPKPKIYPLAVQRDPFKVAFNTNQFSGPMNPDIRSGASDLPPFRAPQLRRGIQKSSGAVTPTIGPSGGDLTKAGASAPTRGNFMMASDIPPFQSPQLRRGIQKNSGESSMPVSGPLGGSSVPLENSGKSAAGMVDGVTANSNDFKPAKLSSITTEQLAFYVWGLRKQADVSPASSWNGGTFGGAGPRNGISDIPPFRRPQLARAIQKTGMAGMTPAGHLAKTQSVGAPKAAAPPGPSIADIAKPRGARFGSAIPGAQKGGIGGYVQPDLKL